MTRRYVVGLVLCLVAAAIVGFPAAAAQETTTDTATTATATNDTDDGPGLGTQLTAFLQSSSAATNDTVENGMWQAGFERANESKRAQMVTSRTGALEQRLERLRERNESLRERYEKGTLPRQAYVAQQSRLVARIDALETAVNDTGEAAAVAGVEDSRIERLKQNASRLSGPDVAAIVRGNGGGPPIGVPGQSETDTDEENTSSNRRGPAAGEGPLAAGGDGAGPRNGGGANTSTNETADATDSTGNATNGDGGVDDRGNAPDDAGNAADSDGDGSTSDDSGGNGGNAPDGTGDSGTSRGDGGASGPES